METIRKSPKLTGVKPTSSAVLASELAHRTVRPFSSLSDEILFEQSGFRRSIPERCKVKIFIYSALLISSIVLFGISLPTLAQTRRQPAAPRVESSMLFRLPASDAVAHVQVRRVLNEMVPKLADTPAKLAEVNRQIEDFKTRTGLDARSFTEMALGLTYSYPAEGVTKVKTLAIASGNFDERALSAAGAASTRDKYREQKYKSANIYIFTLDQQVRLFGMFTVNVRELAVCPLDR